MFPPWDIGRAASGSRPDVNRWVTVTSYSFTTAIELHEKSVKQNALLRPLAAAFFSQIGDKEMLRLEEHEGMKKKYALSPKTPKSFHESEPLAITANYRMDLAITLINPWQLAGIDFCGICLYLAASNADTFFSFFPLPPIRKEPQHMDKTKKQNQQRKYKRFSDSNGAAAAALTLGSWSKWGLITDISKGGLVFRYLDFKIAPKEEPADYAELKIIWESRRLTIDNMPCRVIEDYDASPEYSFNLIPMRKCRVAFGDLAPDQTAQLNKVKYHRQSRWLDL